MSNEEITIRFFKATEDRMRCVRYVMEHVRVLEDIGVALVLKVDISWCADPNVIVGVAEHPEFGMIAGIRIHLANKDRDLPMQHSLAPYDSNAREHIASLESIGNCEIAGLWNANRYAGRGVYKLLISAAVALASRYDLRTMVCLAAEYVAPTCRSVGFTEIAEIGDRGGLAFPIPSIHSYAMVIPDLLTLCGAEHDERQRLMSLRLRPYQSRSERPKNTPLLVHYDLMLQGYHYEGGLAATRTCFAA